MVLSREIVRAARRGRAHIIRTSQIYGGSDINDVDYDGKERTLLILATIGPRSDFGEFDERHLALARYLLDHGADANRRDYRHNTPLHYASLGRSVSSPAMAALLLKAGANVLVKNDNNNNPLTLVLGKTATEGTSSLRMKIALMLLRALPSLDCAWTSVTGLDYSIEWVLDSRIILAGDTPPAPIVDCFDVLRAVVAGVRAAGGWRAYDRRPRAEVLRLLALRRCAVVPSATRHDGPHIRSLDFLVRCPPEIAWQILGYWRCHYPVDTHLIDRLGFH